MSASCDLGEANLVPFDTQPRLDVTKIDANDDAVPMPRAFDEDRWARTIGAGENFHCCPALKLHSACSLHFVAPSNLVLFAITSSSFRQSNFPRGGAQSLCCPSHGSGSLRLPTPVVGKVLAQRGTGCGPARQVLEFRPKFLRRFWESRRDANVRWHRVRRNRWRRARRTASLTICLLFETAVDFVLHLVPPF